MTIRILTRTIGIIVFFALQCHFIFAQVPHKVSYQMVVRNASGQLVKELPVGVRLSILQDSAQGSAVYVETHTIQSNKNGLVSLEVGAGTYTGSTFAEIVWADGPYFLKIETDPAGGSAYAFNGISEILSVPYALHSRTAESYTGTLNETDPSVPIGLTTGEMQIWNGTSWISLAPGSNGSVLTISNGAPKWINPNGINEVINPATGKTWMDRNLGASRAASGSTVITSYGDLYQWGRATDGHQLRTSDTTLTLSTSDTPGHGKFICSYNIPADWRSPANNNLWQGVSGINNPCPSGFRLPTEAELNEERGSWSSNDAAGAFESPLKLPLPGHRNYGDGSLLEVGTIGYYWSSTVSGFLARMLLIEGSDAQMLSFSSPYGFSVRCIKD